MVFYTHHPIVLKNIYDQVLEELNKIAARDSL
jgi:hypothetical protein